MANSFTSSYSLHGRVALVTGASQGIGAAIALMLGEMGADVAINHLGDAEGAERVADAVRASGSRALCVDADISRRDIVAAVLAPVLQGLGPIDVLVVCAARSRNVSLEQLEDDEIDAQIETNLKSTLRLLDSVVPSMVERQFGRVVTIGSITQEAPLPDLPVYGALKAAQLSLVRGMAVRWARSGVTFNSVSPGLIRTPRNAWRRDPGGDWETFSSSCSYMGRAGEPAEVASVVAMFCAPGASFVTGENVFVAGGAQVPGRR